MRWTGRLDSNSGSPVVTMGNLAQRRNLHMMGADLRTDRCDHCRKEHTLDFGVAMWKLMSDANKSKAGE